jgi:hypothetical protein
MADLVCCADPTFELIEELGHVEAVDWDLGRCGSCGSYVLRSWSPHAPLRTIYEPLTEQQADQFRTSRGNERLTQLKAWFAEQ